MSVALLTAADGFVIAMLAMMMLSLGTIGALILCMRRNAARNDPMVEELLREVAAEEEKQERRATTTAEDPKPADPWEREADWWKKPGSKRTAKKKR